ncbi:MAG: RDD family protein [Chloroflexota bacterium]
MTEGQGPAPGVGEPVGDAAGAAADAAQGAAGAAEGAAQPAAAGLGDAASSAAADAKKGLDGLMGQLNQPGASGSSFLQGVPPVAGPMGLIYGDVLNRSIAYIIDAIIIGIVSAVLSAIVGAIFGPVISININNLFTGSGGLTDVNWLVVILDFVIGLAVSVAYFVYLWTAQRATLGMRVMSLQVGNETNGATLGRDQAVLRWALLFGPAALSQAFWPVPALGMLLGLASFVWFLALLFTTWSSPTKQGLHDRYAHTMVVKSVRTVA